MILWDEFIIKRGGENVTLHSKKDCKSQNTVVNFLRYILYYKNKSVIFQAKMLSIPEENITRTKLGGKSCIFTGKKKNI